MDGLFKGCLLLTGLMMATSAAAVTGEWWEITGKTEMPGMPMVMPEQTMRVCLPVGAEKDPRQTMRDPQSQCEMTDIHANGNKVSWKVRCNQDGMVMNGVGETTSSANGYEGSMQMSGRSGGMEFNMKQHYRGKKTGGSCEAKTGK